MAAMTRIAFTGMVPSEPLQGSLADLWMGLFSNDAEVARLGALYLRTSARPISASGWDLDYSSSCRASAVASWP